MKTIKVTRHDSIAVMAGILIMTAAVAVSFLTSQPPAMGLVNFFLVISSVSFIFYLYISRLYSSYWLCNQCNALFKCLTSRPTSLTCTGCNTESSIKWQSKTDYWSNFINSPIETIGNDLNYINKLLDYNWHKQYTNQSSTKKPLIFIAYLLIFLLGPVHILSGIIFDFNIFDFISSPTQRTAISRSEAERFCVDKFLDSEVLKMGRVKFERVRSTKLGDNKFAAIAYYTLNGAPRGFSCEKIYLKDGKMWISLPPSNLQY